MADKNALTAAIGAGGQAVEAPAVKALNWYETDDENVWRADSIIGEFEVGFDDGWYATLDGFKWEWEPEQDSRSYFGPTAGQAACQRYFGEKIRSALAPSPSQPDGEIERRAAAYDYLEAPDAVDWKSRAEALSAALEPLTKNFAVFTIEDDDDSIRLSVHGKSIANCGGHTPEGIALLKLDADQRSARSLLNGEKARDA